VVFVDPTGRRARVTHLLLRVGLVLCVGGLALLVTSLLGGVPLPGLTAPVRLPSNEPAHSRAAQPTPAVAGAPARRSASATGAGTPGSSPTGGGGTAAARTSNGAAPRSSTAAPPTVSRVTSSTTAPTAPTSTGVARGAPSGQGSLHRHTPTPHSTRTPHATRTR
jgi:hypothetical protein